jgi:tetratricopeptide (TPR) repeat protein
MGRKALTLFIFTVLAIAAVLLFFSGEPVRSKEVHQLVDATSGATKSRMQEDVEHSPGTAKESYAMGRLYLVDGEYRSALVLFNEAIDIDPTFAEAYYVRGRVYLKLDDISKALDDFNRVIELAPEGARVLAASYYSRAGILLDRGEYQRAIEDTTKALELMPHTAMFHALRGEAYQKTGNTERALRDYETAADLDPAYEMRLKKKINELRQE